MGRIRKLARETDASSAVELGVTICLILIVIAFAAALVSEITGMNSF